MNVETDDQRQDALFRKSYDHLIDALQNAELPLEISADPLQIDLERTRAATGAIRVQSGTRRASIPVTMQGNAIWVAANRIHPLPGGTLASVGYYFEDREAAASYLVAAAAAFASANP